MQLIELLKQLIAKYEAESISFEELSRQFVHLGIKNIDRYSIENYWRSYSLDDFAELLLAQKAVNQTEIDEYRALEMIKEITNNPDNFALIDRYATDLENAYKKPNGLVLSLIMNEGLSAIQVLEKLQKPNLQLP